MNKIELKEALISEGIRSDMYNLEGGLPNESYCLSRDGRKWTVYYSERGVKTEIHEFDSEHDACAYFYELILNNFH